LENILKVTLDDNIMMFVSNIRAGFLKRLNLLCVLFPCHGINEEGATGKTLCHIERYYGNKPPIQSLFLTNNYSDFSSLLSIPMLRQSVV
jgi:hypothetical protein